MALAQVTLEDKYVKEKGRVYLAGTQALVRLPMLQHQRDKAAGRSTFLCTSCRLFVTRRAVTTSPVAADSTGCADRSTGRRARA